ncbi:DUF3048 domain-containing protein [Candidatus Saccharibacteria bacterium]|nr:DUF3048 domain-containing protein [Candidatus Saccharibacteria bacterium]
METPNESETLVASAEALAKKRLESTEKPKEKKSHKKLVITLLSVFVVLGATASALFYFYFEGKTENVASFFRDTFGSQTVSPSGVPNEILRPETPADSASDSVNSGKTFSRLSGEPLENAEDDSAPTFCVQIPNGVDGARPQVGLDSAKIVFEAIAEAGITRFAAIFQNPPAVIGPIRSLRIYYLNWDTPFDCTIVHAGGADDAISALRAGGYRELDENYSYMFRENNYNRLWNNLFTTGESLRGYGISKGYLSSDIKSFPRKTPEETKTAKIDAQSVRKLKIDEPAEGNTSELSPKVSHVVLRFGSMPTFNPVFEYNAESNSYRRSYETGVAHTVKSCSDATENPDACPDVQLSPSVVIAMLVQERRAAYDNYHEDISSIGAGDAYIFQNGDAIKGTWEKSSASAQIIFRDSENNEISLNPGQTWISAVPAYGSVEY